MHDKRSPDLDDAVTVYVRRRLQELYEGGEELRAMAERVGISSSGVSQVKNGVHGVRNKIAEYAQILGFRDVDELRYRAYSEWCVEYDKRRIAAARSSTESARPRARRVP